MIRLLHTADIHFGKKFVHLGERGPAQRKAIKDAFSRVVDLAIEREVHGVLLAGDIFDSHRVSELDFQFFVKELTRLSKEGVYSFVIAGNHDYLGDGSVFLRDEFRNNEKIVFFDQDKTRVVIPEFDLTVFGASCTSKKSTKSPLSLFDSSFDTKHGVAVIHGSFAIPEKHTPDSYPFTLQEIENSGLDYIACGDWHSQLELPSKRTKAAYSGSPEVLDFDQTGSGGVLLVEIDSAVEIEPIHVGKYQFAELELDLTGRENPVDFIEREVAILSGQNMIVSVSLLGVLSPSQLISAARLEEQFQEDFYSIRIEDRTSIEITDEALSSFPEEMVSGKFVRIMQEKIAQADPMQKEILEKALQVGLQQLEGKE